jgi:hypothetical protein
MKNFILLMVALSGCAFSYGQKFEVGVNGGLGFNTVPLGEEYSTGRTVNRKVSPSVTVSATAMYVRKKWYYGIEVGSMPLSYNFHTFTHYTLNGFTRQDFGWQEVEIRIAKPAIPVKAVIERTWHYKKFSIYGTVTPGYVFISNSSSIREEDSANTITFHYVARHGHGLTFGLHVGGTYYLSERVGINAQAGTDYYRLTFSSDDFYALLAFPFTVGFRYKL